MTSAQASRRHPIITLIVLLVASAAIFAGLRTLENLGIGFHDGTALLEQLVEKAAIDTAKADPVSVTGPDGPMPEIATWHIPMTSGHQQAIATLRKACSELNLGAPPADMLAAAPEIICSGRHQGARVNVGVFATPGNPAYLSIETRTVRF